MLMSLGMFQFEIGSLPYQELARSRAWRFGRTERFGTGAATQFLGPGEDKVTLSGALLPTLAGRFSSIETLAAIADEGKALPLTSGTGEILGNFTIDQLDYRGSTFTVDGVPRRGDFTVTLTRDVDAEADQGAR